MISLLQSKPSLKAIVFLAYIFDSHFLIRWLAQIHLTPKPGEVLSLGKDTRDSWVVFFFPCFPFVSLFYYSKIQYFNVIEEKNDIKIKYSAREK